MITGIKLKNWRSHLESSLTFTKGTNALVGILGSGKSSVMNALCFGLFGTFPDLQTRKVKLDDIIMNKPEVKNTAEIIVDFEIGGKNYSIMRVIERGKGTTYSEIKEEDKLLDSPNTQRVTELVEKTLKVNYELFSKAIYSEQNNIDYFLRLPKGERMRRMDNLLMIDRFEKVRSSSTSLKNKLIDRKLGKQSVIDQTDVLKLKTNLKEISQGLDEIQNEKENFSKDLKIINSEKTTIQEKLNRLEKLNEKLIDLRQEKSKIETSIKENEKSVQSIEELLKDIEKDKIKEKVEQLKNELEVISKKYNENKSEYENLTRKISEQKTRIDFLEKDKIIRLNTDIKNKIEFESKLKEIKQKYENPDLDLKNFRGKLDETNKQLTIQLTRKESLEKSLQEIEKLENKCPVCESSITRDKKNKLIQDRTDNLKQIELDAEKLKKQKILLQSNISELEDIVDDYKKYSRETENISELKNQLESLQKEYNDLKNNLFKRQESFEKVKQEILSIEKEMDEKKNNKQNLELVMTRINEYNERKLTLIELEKRKLDIENNTDQIKKDIGDEKIEQIREKFNEIIKKKSGLETKMQNIDQVISEKNNRKKEYEDKIDFVEKEKTEIKNLEEIVKGLQIFSKALEHTQVELRKEFIDTVNYTMSTIWSSIYPYDDFVGARLEIIDRDYVLQLKERLGDWVEVERIASGGERSIACLVLKVAFALVLAPQLKWLVLDEPTHNLDRKAVEDLSQTLRTRVGDFIEQIFLITHDEKLEDSVTGNLYRLEREKEKDGVTKIIQVN